VRTFVSDVQLRGHQAENVPKSPILTTTLKTNEKEKEKKKRKPEQP